MRHPIRSLLLALSLVPGILAMSAHAQNATITTDGTLLNVSARAEARRVPDVATISAGVVAQASDGNTAMRENATRMARVMDAIKAAGIAEKDIQTSGISLNPQYHFEQNQPPKITGYEARNSVSLKVRDIAKLGKVLDALAASGANDINGPSFGIDQPEPVQDEARLAALQKAQARADTYAKALNLRVRRIVSIDESGSGGLPRPVPMMAIKAMDASTESTQVSPGESVLSVNLNVVFELGK
ncbi:MAG: SIMPL domain-containing protein [Pseudoxanthomonas sp.]